MVTTKTRPDSGDKSTSVVVLGILFALGGLGGLGYGVNSVVRAESMKRWPTTAAVITASRTRQQNPRGGSGSTTTITEIRYRYEVAGHAYTSDRVTTARYGSSNAARAHGQVRRYPVGREVIAHYSPDDASTAVLETAWDKVYGLAFAAGLGALLLGGLMLRNAVRGRRG